MNAQRPRNPKPADDGPVRRRPLAVRPSAERLEIRAVLSGFIDGVPGRGPGTLAWAGDGGPAWLPVTAGRATPVWVGDSPRGLWHGTSSVRPGGPVDVVLLDGNLPDLGVLESAVRPGAVTFVYDSRAGSAGAVLTEVAHWAEASGERIASLSILDHGAPGRFELGGQWVSAGDLDATAGAWRLLADEMATGAEINLFGCNLDAGGAGRALIDRLSALTGARVLASDDLTGRGGDWVLERGSAGTHPVSAADWSRVLDPTALLRWEGTLGIQTGNVASATTGGANSASLMWSHTVAAGTNTVLMVAVTTHGNLAVSSVLYGPTALTLLGASVDSSNTSRVEIWYLRFPVAGTQNVTVTLPSVGKFAAGSTDFSGVSPANPLGPYAGASGNSATPGLTLSSAPGELVFDALSARGDMAPVIDNAGQTGLWTQTSRPEPTGVAETTPGAASVALSWTASRANQWAVGAVTLRPAVSPTVTVPAAQSVYEGQHLVFSTGGGNPIAVTDPGAGSNATQVTLGVTSGTLSLDTTAGLTFSAGTGTNNASMTFRGTVAAVNAALDGLVYTPAPYFSGGSTLSVGVLNGATATLDLDATLRGHYAFANTGSLGQDTSPAATHGGTAVGATSAVDPVFGNVLRLNAAGGAQYVQIPGLMGTPTSVTLAAWVSLTADSSNGSEVLSIGDSVILRLDDTAVGRVLRASVYDGNSFPAATGTANLAGTGWHHVAMTFNGATRLITLYLDGAAVDTATAVGPIDYDQGVDTFIGTHGNGVNGYGFTGLVADARVYARALNASEVGSLAVGSPQSDSGSVATTVTAVNQPPTGASGAVTTPENTPYTFSAADFGFSDPHDSPPDTLRSVRLTSLPAAGSLQRAGTPVTAGQEVTASDVAAGRLRFIPAVYARGNAYTSFTFQVRDGGGTAHGGVDLDPVPDTLTVNVSSVNQPPVAVDQALKFDGTSAVVVVPPTTSLTMTSAVTVEAWVQSQGTPTGNQLIVNKEGEYELGVSASGTLQWAFANTTLGWNWFDTGVAVPAGQWVQVAVTYDNGVVNTYVNGALQHTYNGTGPIGDAYPTLNNLTIGGRQNTTGQRFQGLIDEVRVWDVARTAAEVAASYDQTLTGAEAGLVGYWRFSEPGGTTAFDLTAHANHGVLGGSVPAREFSVATPQNTPLTLSSPGVLADATDPQGLPLAAQLVTGPSHAAAFALNPDGSVAYTPAINFNGTDSFTFRVSNGSLVSRPVTVLITVSPVNQPPTLASAVSATPSTVVGTTTILSVVGVDDGGESNLTYTWAVTSKPTGAPDPTFSAGGTNAAKTATVTFGQTGGYTFQVTITDAEGLSTTSSVGVLVNPALTAITVTPGSANLGSGQSQAFSAVAYDQFGAALAAQPSLTWSVTGAGSITSGGPYSAPFGSSVATVRATSGAVSGTAAVVVTNAAPTVTVPSSATPNPVTGTTAALNVLGTDDAGESNLTYTWSVAARPAGAADPVFSANATNAAKNTTATFSRAGDYAFLVTITDGGGNVTTSTVSVTVAQTLSAVAVTPASAALHLNQSLALSATGYDQFGDLLAAQPIFSWSVTSGPGTVSPSGSYDPGNTPGSATVRAANGAVSGAATLTVTDATPGVVSTASATPRTVTGTSASLTVLGADDGGESNLTYTWSLTARPAGAADPVFSSNATNDAKNTTATFSRTGDYVFLVTITDNGGSTATSVVSVTVTQTLSTVVVSPPIASLNLNQSLTLSATGYDQFGDPLAAQPAFVWSVASGPGSVDGLGRYASGATAGTARVTATCGTVVGSTSVDVVNAAPTVASAATASPNPYAGSSTVLSVLGADDGGESNLVYTWSVVDRPAGAPDPTFSSNASHTAWQTTAVFGQPGRYTLLVTVTDSGGLSATGLVTVDHLNNAPSLTRPGSQRTPSGVPVTFGVAKGTPVRVDDADAGSLPVQVTLAATHGTLTLGQSTGLAFSLGWGRGDATMTFEGTLADVNAALEGLVFTPESGFMGDAGLDVTVDDLGNTGVGGPMQARGSVAVLVGGVVVSPADGLVTSQAGEQAVFTVTLAAQPTADVTVTLSSSDPTQGVLSTGTLTFTPADWNVPRTVTVTGVDNHRAQGDVAYAVRLGPVSSTDPAYDRIAVADLPVVNRQTDVAAVVLTPTSGLATSRDGGQARFTVVLATQPATPVTIPLASSDPSQGVADASRLTFTPDDWNVPQTVVVTGVQDYRGLGDTPYRIVTGPVDSTDPVYNGLTAPAVSLVNRAVADRPPSLVVPGPQSTHVNVPVVFSGATHNPISVGDADAGPNTIQVTLKASQGTLDLVNTAGLRVGGGGNGSGLLVLTGTLHDLNAALDGLRFLPPLNSAGTLWLMIEADDLGHSGTGGPLRDTEIIAVAVVNAAPGIDEVRPLTLDGVVSDGVPHSNPGTSVADLLRSRGSDPISDPDVGANLGIAVVGADDTHGAWQYSLDGGGHWADFAAVSERSATLLTSSSETIVRFVPATGFAGVTTLTFRAWDTTDGWPAGSSGVDTTANGGQTAYSTATLAAAVTVKAPPPATLAPVTPTPATVMGVVPPPARTGGPGIGDGGSGLGGPGDPNPQDSLVPLAPPMNQDGATPGRSVLRGGTGPARGGARLRKAPTGSTVGPADDAQGGGDDATDAAAANGSARPTGTPTQVAEASIFGLDPARLFRALASLATGPADPTRNPKQGGPEDLLAFETKALWDQLDTMDREMADIPAAQAVTVAALTGLTVSVGYVVWTTRASYLIAGLLTAAPLWKEIDPLVILESKRREWRRGPRRRASTDRGEAPLASILKPHRRRARTRTRAPRARVR